MLFNSLQFLVFLFLIFIAYWAVNKKGLHFQNSILLIASYYFYSCWDWRFLFLLIFSTGLDFFTGLKMHQAKNRNNKKIWFWLSVSINFGFLGVFKYYNFFATSFANALLSIGFHSNFWTIQVILPVGISFYTFHGLSYIIDIYKNRIEPEKKYYYLFIICELFSLVNSWANRTSNPFITSN